MVLEGLILILASIGIAQAIFLCTYLFTLKKGDRLANAFLGSVLLGLAIRIGKSVLNNYIVLEPWQRNLGISGILIVGPFLLFYGKVLLEKQKTFNNKNYLHLTVFALFLLLSPFIPNSNTFESYVSYALVLFHLAIYLFLVWRFLVGVRKTADQRLYEWYRTIVLGISLIWFFYLGIFIGFIPFYLGGAVLFSFLVYAFSYLLLKRHVFALEKYGNSKMDREKSRRLVQRIMKWFEKEETYLQNSITMDFVAKKLDVSHRAVSQAINENKKMNFSEFVNHYRIKKAKELLQHPDYLQCKIATIAYDCGFGTIASFNKAFKAETQLTPSQYRNK